MKVTFPSLRNVLQLNSIVKLLRATLILRPAIGSYDVYNLKLPSLVHLAQTNGSNVIGSSVTDSTSSTVLYTQPVIDYIYNTGTAYTFDVTTPINNFLTTAGSSDAGFFFLQDVPGSTNQINRVIMNDSKNTTLNSQLILSVLTVKD